jgi:fatty acid desaturase
MMEQTRNYSLAGPEKQRAHERGLVDAEWYQCLIPRARLKQLMQRRNGPALRDTLLWFAILLISGYAAYLSWGTWWAVPAFMLYGAIYTVPAIAKWHEFSHGTPFKTSWMNDVMYYVCSFMTLTQAVYFTWSHPKHHTNTYIVGQDPEFFSPRPPNWRTLLLRFTGISVGYYLIANLFLHSCGRLSGELKEFIPASEQHKVYTEARIWLLLLAGIGVLSIYMGSILPLMLVGLPAIYGFPFNYLLNVTQHAGLSEDVLDHRLNTRTFYTNRIIRFLYSDMNYHLEHHMFPMVPYYNLAALHEEIKHDCPPAYPSYRTALRESVSALWRQRKDARYTAIRPLPDTAKPYKLQPESRMEHS